MFLLKRKSHQSYLQEVGMPVTRASRHKGETHDLFTAEAPACAEHFDPDKASILGKTDSTPAKLSFDLTVDGSTTGLDSHIAPHPAPLQEDKDSSQAHPSKRAQQQQDLLVPAPMLRPIRTRAASAAACNSGAQLSKLPQQSSSASAVEPAPMQLDTPRRTRSQDLKTLPPPVAIVHSFPEPARSSPQMGDDSNTAVSLEREASGLSLQEDRESSVALPDIITPAAAAAATASAASGLAGMGNKEANVPRNGCLRQRHKSKPDGTPDQDQPASPILRTRSGRRLSVSTALAEPTSNNEAAVAAEAAAAATAAAASAAAAAADAIPSSPRTRSMCRRVRFAKGPHEDVYKTPDGHPDHEGQTARQRRVQEAAYPADLTAASIRMLETELGEAYRASIDRLKRRVGLLPRIARPRKHATNRKPGPAALKAIGLAQKQQQQAQPQGGTAGAGVSCGGPKPGLRPLRVLRPRIAPPSLDSESEDEDDVARNDLDSPSSSSTISNDWGSPLRRSLRSTASTPGGSPKAEWTANSGGIRHGVARSAAASRRKPHAPVRARPQSPLGPRISLPPSPRRQCQSTNKGTECSSPRSPRAAQQQGRGSVSLGDPRLQPGSPKRVIPKPYHAQSPQKRSAICLEEPQGHSSDSQPRSPRRQRPPPTSGRSPSYSNAVALSGEVPPLKLGPLPPQGPPTMQPSLPQFLLRSGSLKGVTRCAEPPLSVPSGLNRQHHQPGSPVRPLPPFAGCLQPAPAASQKLLGSPLPQPPPELARGLQQSSAAMHVHTIASTSQGQPVWESRLRSHGELNGRGVQEGVAPTNRRAPLGSLYDPLMRSTRLLRSNSR